MKNMLGDLEEKIMNVIWFCDQALKPSEVKKAIGGDYAYTTIMTVMSRLHQKGILKRKKNGKAYYYSASKEKETFIKPKLRGIFKNILESYGDLAVSQFVDVLETLDPEDLEKLKEYLNDKK